MTNKLFLTHAWFPLDCFDEVVEEKGLVFGRKGDDYLALRSPSSHNFQTEGDDADREIIADVLKNIWIFEMGRREVDGEFNNLINKIANATLSFNRLNFIYHSTLQGVIEFCWQGKLKQQGKALELSNYPRYDKPHSKADFPLSPLITECADNN